MKSYKELSKAELITIRDELEVNYAKVIKRGLSLDMSRGKPSKEQLDLSNDMFKINDLSYAEDGTDCRNYGGSSGIPEARRLMGEVMDVPAENVIVSGNSSLNIMYDTISRTMTHGIMGLKPWCRLEKIKFLCPAPGYDRHFAITEHFGIELIYVPMKDSGPDMDIVEKYVNNDAHVKGIWCTPKYSNPLGLSYSDETVKRFAALKPMAEDFRIYWDDAYLIHHLYDDKDTVLDIFSECKKTGNQDMVLKFCSFSKISFAGASISAIAASKANIDYILNSISIQTIGPDKLNMLRHVKFFKNLAGVSAHMKKHAEILRPKFEAVLNVLNK
ncbi:MAG: aminotransferase class I/II-fold pyridoxal phosphate-dependent enzyme, partial [Lachnospiraceae bacterium]|nr:aminotransferase class I/II-fold pyridoxal phosphate-dependent enzyme [Lachnospiraceae bacterium]